MKTRLIARFATTNRIPGTRDSHAALIADPDIDAI